MIEVFENIGNPHPSGEQTAWDEFMRRPTTTPNVTISLIGFASEDVAQKLADSVRDCLLIFGRILDLSALAQVYISYDYVGTLAALERGFDAQSVLKPTADEVALGIAMTPAVIRDGKRKSVIVLSAYHLIALATEETAVEDVDSLKELKAEMIYTLAHECGHVHDFAVQLRSFPDVILKMKWTFRQTILWGTAHHAWEEYAASRLSASWGTKATFEGLESTFRSRLKDAWPTILKSIRLYRLHADVDRVLNEVKVQIANVLVYAAYLLGHLAGIGETLDSKAPLTIALLAENPEIAPFVWRLREVCDAMFANYEDWSGMEVFDPLAEVVRDFLERAGLTLEETDEKLRVVIPHRSDTLPSLSEQLEFIVQRDQGA